MNNFSLDPQSGEASASSYLTRQPQGGQSQRGLAKVFQWWYRISSPPQPKASASFAERELFRRGRTGSQFFIFNLLLILVSFPAAFAGSNPLLVEILIVDICGLILAAILNRMKRVTLAGIIVVLSTSVSPTFNILTTPGGLNTGALPIFGLLVLSLMAAVSFLPAWWIYVIGVGNSLFIFLTLMFMPSSGDLHDILKIAFPGVVTPIILGQMIVTVVAFLWVRSATMELRRADRAEEIARLEHDLALQAEAVAEQKRQLDVSIQKIVETHVRVANGDLNARVPLTQDNVLWQISGALNNLLARMQRFRQDASEIQKMQFSLKQAQEEIAGLKMYIRENMQNTQ